MSHVVVIGAGQAGKHVWFGMRLGGSLPAEAAVARLRRYSDGVPG